jgi:multiple sugar transport system ATP-binding protein
MSEVRLRNLHKRYGEVHAVKGVDLDVASGELAVLVGPSGCGKSTLLRMIAGLEEVSDGTIGIAGRDVTWDRPRDRDIAMVFQSYALYPYMSVYENVAFGLRARGAPDGEVKKRVGRAAEMLGIGALLDRRPRQLSGGQRQRVAIGRAIVRDARVFLFDEPLSNLDAQLRDDMRGEIKRLHAELAATMIYVTHDQIEAMTLADRIVLLNAGRIEQEGPPLDVFERPRSRFVAEFLGSPRMNFLAGRIADGAFELDGGRLALPPDATSRPAGPTVLGIRPEHVAVAEAAGGPPPGRGRLEGRVEFVQPTGTRAYLTCRVGAASIMAETAAHGAAARDGARVALDFDLRRAVLIDPPSGRVLWPAPAS